MGQVAATGRNVPAWFQNGGQGYQLWTPAQPDRVKGVVLSVRQPGIDGPIGKLGSNDVS